MKQLFAFFALLLVCIPAYGQQTTEKPSSSDDKAEAQATRKDFVSDASFIIGTYIPASNDHSPQSIAATANKFLDSLNPDQRKRAVHDLQSRERRDWTNLPARPNAGGIRFGDLDESQVKAACDLLAALLSKKGYAKMKNIMLADDQLLRGGQARQGFGTEDFSLVLFGTPSESDAWALQLDGHHLGLNVSLAGENLTLSPSFIGTQPEAFELSSKEYRPLSGETDLGYKLINSLSDDQKLEAIIRPRRAQLQTGPGRDGQVPKVKGVSCATFNDDQKQVLTSLISQWVDNYPESHGKARMDQLKAEIDQMHFSWYGPISDRSDVSYAIQGPSLIIEYACQSMGGNPLDHLHTMYRDPTNEYLGQLDK